MVKALKGLSNHKHKFLFNISMLRRNIFERSFDRFSNHFGLSVHRPFNAAAHYYLCATEKIYLTLKYNKYLWKNNPKGLLKRIRSVIHIFTVLQ